VELTTPRNFQLCLLWRYMCPSHTAMYKFSCAITVLSNVHKRLILGLPAPRTISGCCAQRQPESQPQVNHRVAVQTSRLDSSRDHTLSTEGYSCHCIYSTSNREWNELAQAIPCSNLRQGQNFCGLPQFLQANVRVLSYVRPRSLPPVACRRGVWGVQAPPKFRRPSKIVLNSTRLWKLLKIA